MIESDKTKRIARNFFYVWVQEELPNKFYSVNQHDTHTPEDPDDIRKMTSETE
jgi:hypothetical protein